MRQGRSSPPHHANQPAAAISNDPELFTRDNWSQAAGDHHNHEQPAQHRQASTETPLSIDDAGFNGEHHDFAEHVESFLD